MFGGTYIVLYLSYVFQCLLLLRKRFPLNNLNSIEFQDLNFVCDDIISFRLTVYSEGIFTVNIKRVAFSFSLLEGITPKLAKTIKKIRMESIRKCEPLQPEWIWSLLFFVELSLPKANECCIISSQSIKHKHQWFARTN